MDMLALVVVWRNLRVWFTLEVWLHGGGKKRERSLEGSRGFGVDYAMTGRGEDKLQLQTRVEQSAASIAQFMFSWCFCLPV